jgi:hypothetical protein
MRTSLRNKYPSFFVLKEFLTTNECLFSHLLFVVENKLLLSLRDLTQPHCTTHECMPLAAHEMPFIFSEEGPNLKSSSEGFPKLGGVHHNVMYIWVS